ncbi:MAG TPA: hypothetical protein VFQ45_09600 [Longimicrobium sp.]|nr:hypothetical protein [Longimicrobium sp.]
MRPRDLLLAGALALVPLAVSGQSCPWGGSGRCFLPLDLAQGLVLDAGEPTPYTFSARLNPSAGLGDGGTFRVGPALAVSYLNPQWEASAGVGVSVRLLRLRVPHWGVFVGAEQAWSTEGRTPAAGSVVVNAGMIRIGSWAVHDWESEDTALLFSFGTDLKVLLPFLFPRRDPDPFAEARP